MLLMHTLGRVRPAMTPLNQTMSLYTSEITEFLKALKAQNPRLEAQQRAGRARLWDRAPVDLDLMRRWRESRVRQKAYPYQPD